MKITTNNQSLYPVKELSDPKPKSLDKTSKNDDLKQELPKIDLDKLSEKMAEALLFKF